MSASDTTDATGATGAVDALPRLILASASPARLRTLRAAGIDTEAIVSGVDESQVVDARPERLCATLARLKAEAVAARIPASPGALVLGCDSVLGFDGAVLGKPLDEADAVRRWREMRGRSGVLYTGHCLIETATGRQVAAVGATSVFFADLSDAEIDAYVATGEPLQVAGAFTIDGIGGAFVERIAGDPGTVIGVSLPLLRHLLHDLGLTLPQLWRPRR